jgi:hypothetical protein
MLRISIPSNGPAKINFSTFMNYLLPVPPKGIDSSVDNDAVLLFDNEDEAKTYADHLTKLPGSQRKIGNEIVSAIMKPFGSKEKKEG